MTPPLALSIAGIGVIISLIGIGLGLVWLFYRSWTGREVDRRIIFLFIFLAVAVPVLFPIVFREKASPTVRAVFARIESLPAGSKVLMSYDYDPAGMPELQPQADAMVRHALARGHRVVFMGLWATGHPLLNLTIENVVRREFPDKQYGVDYAALGYKAGNEGVLNVIVTDLRKMYPSDVNATPLERLPIFNGVNSCRDFNLIICMGSGKPGCKEWILFVGDPTGVPIVSGLAAVSTPQLYPYYPKQLKGLLGGVKGAAEYESELLAHYPQFAGMPTPALRMMGPQTMAHLVIMAFIVIGNVAYLRARRKGEQK